MTSAAAAASVSREIIQSSIYFFFYVMYGERAGCARPRVLPGAVYPARAKIVKAEGILKFIFQLPGGILFAGKIAGFVRKPCPSPIFRDAPSPPRRSRESGAGGRNQIPCRFFWHISC